MVTVITVSDAYLFLCLQAERIFFPNVYCLKAQTKQEFMLAHWSNPHDSCHLGMFIIAALQEGKLRFTGTVSGPKASLAGSGDWIHFF